jgi:hypothetical protein
MTHIDKLSCPLQPRFSTLRSKNLNNFIQSMSSTNSKSDPSFRSTTPVDLTSERGGSDFGNLGSSGGGNFGNGMRRGNRKGGRDRGSEFNHVG